MVESGKKLLTKSFGNQALTAILEKVMYQTVRENILFIVPFLLKGVSERCIFLSGHFKTQCTKTVSLMAKFKTQNLQKFKDRFC